MKGFQVFEDWFEAYNKSFETFSVRSGVFRSSKVDLKHIVLVSRLWKIGCNKVFDVALKHLQIAFRIDKIEFVYLPKITRKNFLKQIFFRLTPRKNECNDFVFSLSLIPTQCA